MVSLESNWLHVLLVLLSVYLELYVVTSASVSKESMVYVRWSFKLLRLDCEERFGAPDGHSGLDWDQFNSERRILGKPLC